VANEAETTTRTTRGVSRRTVVRGSAWAVPAVVVATAAPAMAASPSECITATFGGNSCKQPGEGTNAKGYRLQICFSNICNVPAVILVRTVRGNTGGSPTQNVNQTVTVPANAGNAAQCIANPVIYCNGNSVNKIEVVFSVNGGPNQTQLVDSPPDCSTPQTFCT
jgi:hypothetical protein